MAKQSFILFGFSAVAFVAALQIPQPSPPKEVSLDIIDIAPPSAEVLSILSMNHSLGVADLVWLDVVQAIGRSDNSSIDWKAVLRGARIVVRLDPLYEDATFSAASVLLAFGKKPGLARNLLVEAHNALPGSWKLTLLLGYEALFVRGDFEDAARWYGLTAQREGAPRFIASLAARVRFLSGDSTGALEFLESMLPTLPPLAREDAEWRLKALKSEPLFAQVEDACKQWQAAKGKSPSMGRLVEGTRLEGASLPTKDLLGGLIELDDTCGAFSDQISKTQRSDSLTDFARRLVQKTEPSTELPPAQDNGGQGEQGE